MESKVSKDVGGVSSTTDNPKVKIKAADKPKKEYPYTVRRAITVKRRHVTGILPVKNVTYEPAEDYTYRIGSSFKKGTSMPLGLYVLTKEETAVCMPQLLGKSMDSTDWNKTLQMYWHSLSVPVPFKGLKLNISKIYTNVIVDSNGKEKEIWEAENPLHYVLWKYCLQYAEVANTKEEIHNSPKINFYLEDEVEEKRNKSLEIKLKDEAVLARIEAGKDFEKTRSILYMFNITSSDEESDYLMLTSLADKEPAKFLRFYKDKNILQKAFVQQCIAKGLLFSPPGSTLISFEGTPIGNNLDEAIAFLADPKNGNIKVTLTAKLQNR